LPSVSDVIGRVPSLTRWSVTGSDGYCGCDNTTNSSQCHILSPQFTIPKIFANLRYSGCMDNDLWMVQGVNARVGSQTLPFIKPNSVLHLPTYQMTPEDQVQVFPNDINVLNFTTTANTSTIQTNSIVWDVPDLTPQEITKLATTPYYVTLNDVDCVHYKVENGTLTPLTESDFKVDDTDAIYGFSPVNTIPGV